MMNKSFLPFFFCKEVFFFVCLLFLIWCVNCTFYGTQKTKVSSVCLTLKYLTELKVYFPDLEDRNEIFESDEHLCCRDGNVTCCFNSCTLFFYQTLGLSFYADHKCCPTLLFVYYTCLRCNMTSTAVSLWACFIPTLAGTWWLTINLPVLRDHTGHAGIEISPFHVIMSVTHITLFLIEI